MKDKELLRLLQKSGWKIDRPLYLGKRQSDGFPTGTRQGYEKGLRNRNTKESGTKVKVNAGASPQGA